MEGWAEETSSRRDDNSSTCLSVVQTVFVCFFSSDWVSFLMFDVLIFFFFIKINTFHSHEGLCVFSHQFIHSFIWVVGLSL